MVLNPLACSGQPRDTSGYPLAIRSVGDGVSVDRQTSVRRLASPEILGYRPEDIVTIPLRYLNLRDGFLHVQWIIEVFFPLIPLSRLVKDLGSVSGLA